MIFYFHEYHCEINTIIIIINMWQNIIVALSNLPAIYPITVSFMQGDYLTCCCISFVTFFSFTSHLAENHKHGMPGIGFSKRTSDYLNKMDILGCALTGIRFSYLYYNLYGFRPVILSNPWLCAASVISLCFGKLSEYKKYDSRLQNRYIITHCLWHLSIFPIIGKFLTEFIY